VVVDAYPYDPGGAHRLICRMAGLLDADWQVGAVLPDHGGSVELLRECGVAAAVVPAPASLLGYGGSTVRGRALRGVLALPGYWWRMTRHLRANADIVVANDLRGLILGGVPARLARRRLVWWVHAWPPEWQRLGRPFSRLASGVIASSAPLLEMSVHGGRVVAPPVDLPEPGSETPTSPPEVACIARLHPQKGLDVLIEASALLRDRGVDHRLVIVGGTAGDDVRDQVDALIARHSLAEQVDLRGHVSDVGAVFRSATVYVQSSRSAEGFGMAVLEAMAYGVPVVATDVGGLHDLVTDVGVLVPPEDAVALADAVASLLSDPARRAGLAAAGVDRAARHDPADWARQMVSALTGTVAA
jgi:glycosyltransferase involved in cell wall biosynthesis